MCLVERGAHLARDGQNLVHGLGLAAAKRLAFDQLHHDKECAACPRRRSGVRFANVVHRNDVGMIELGGGLGLAQQTGAAFGAQAGSAQHLDGHIAVEQCIVRAIDDAYAAAAQLRVEAVALVQNGAYHDALVAIACFTGLRI